MADGAGNGSDTDRDGEGDADRDDAGGTYTLVVELADAATIEVGALGPVEFDAGWYAYTGSALGPGGFARVDRHRELAAGDRDARHWHVDYLLGHPGATVREVVRTRGADVECAVSGAVTGDRTSKSRSGPESGPRSGSDAPERVPAFGASDCDCDSHLAYASDRDDLLRAVRRAHENCR